MSSNKIEFKILLLPFDKLVLVLGSWPDEIAVRKQVQIRNQTPACRTGKCHDR